MAAQTALVIDDEAQIRRVVSHALADDFSNVVEAATGLDGVRLAAMGHQVVLQKVGTDEWTAQRFPNG